MLDQIDEQLKQDRADILMREQQAVVDEYLAAKVGQTICVLVEDFDPVSEAHYGRSAADAPEIDGKIFFVSPVLLRPVLLWT